MEEMNPFKGINNRKMFCDRCQYACSLEESEIPPYGKTEKNCIKQDTYVTPVA
jgi:hypothetical protein